MSVNHLVYIYHGNNIDKNNEKLHLVTKSNFRFVAIGVNKLEEVIEHATTEARLGADCIELCGAFDTAWKNKVQELVGNRVQVGNARY